VIAAALLLPLSLTGLARAADYPAGPVRIVVPFPAGGPADLVARTIAARLSDALGQPVLVESRDGAGGNIGTAQVARAAPDGQTLLLGTNGPLVINVSLVAALPFDPLRDFAPVSLLASVPLYLAAHAASVPAGTPQELVAWLRSRPGGEVSFASSGVGSGGHLAGVLLSSMTGVPLTHVPYRGAAPAVTDLIGGRVPLLFVGLPAVAPHLDNGRVKLIGVATPRRTTARPDVPTIAEGGLPGFEIASWYGLLAPAGTPRPVVERLHRETVRILRVPEVQEVLFVRNGLEHVGSTPKDFAATLRREIPEYQRIVRLSGATQN
jgi:tripartite-type tricarboxylate transporter receptor subunit TctC